MGPEDLLGSNCYDISVLHNPIRCSHPKPAQRDVVTVKKGRRENWWPVFKLPFSGAPSWLSWSLCVSVPLPLLPFTVCSGRPYCLPQVCSAVCHASDASSVPGCERNPATVWMQKLYLQGAWHYPSGGGFGGFQCVVHLASYREHSTSHCPLQSAFGQLGLGFCSQHRDRDANRTRLIVSEQENSQT